MIWMNRNYMYRYPSKMKLLGQLPRVSVVMSFRGSSQGTRMEHTSSYTETPCFVRAPTIFQPRTPSVTIAFCMSTGFSLYLSANHFVQVPSALLGRHPATFSVTAVLMHPCQTTNRSPFYWRHLLVYELLKYVEHC